MTLRAMPTPIEHDRTTYLPTTLPEIHRHGHLWVEVSNLDMFPDDPEHRGKWRESTYVCRQCRRVSSTTNRRTEPTIFTVRLQVYVPTACPDASWWTKAHVALVDWMRP